MVTFSTPSLNANLNVEFDVPITGDSFPTGLSGYVFEYTLSANLEVVDVIFPAFGITSHTPPQIAAADIANLVDPGAVDVLIATLRLKILAVGIPGLRLTSSQLDDDVGNPLTARFDIGTITITRTAPEEDLNVRIIERGLQSRPDATLVTMLDAVTTKSSVYDEDIRSLTVFPGAKLDELDKEGITGARAQTELAETLQFYTDKKARLLDKKFLMEKEQEFRRDGKVVRVIVA